MTLPKLFAIARKHLGDNASARVCFADAIACLDRGDYHHAAYRALDSLRFSVGIFSPTYRRAAAFVKPN